MKDKILEAVQISKTYGEGESAVHALRNSDLTLENGTFASIIGSSGSGKSTLLKILGGLLPPTTGKVLLDGQDIYVMNAEQLAQVRRQKIGFIFQDFRLFPEYTVRDNILIPFYLDHRAPDEQMLHKLTGILGIAGKLHSRPHSSPVDSSSVWRSLVRSSQNRASFLPMNQPEIWIHGRVRIRCGC